MHFIEKLARTQSGVAVMFRDLAHASVFALLFGLTGCSSTSVYAPDQLAQEIDRTVTIHAKDGSVIRFAPGDYDIIAGARDSISGVGQIVTNSVSNASEEWEGSIALDDIESVTTTQLNVLGTTTLFAAVILGSWTLTHLSPFDGWR